MKYFHSREAVRGGGSEDSGLTGAAEASLPFLVSEISGHENCIESDLVIRIPSNWI